MGAKIWIADKMAGEASRLLESHASTVADVAPGMPVEEQIAYIKGVEGLVIRSSTKLNGALLEAADSLKIVIRAGIGVDNIDIPRCTEKGILVENTPHGNATSAAEHAIALMFSLARHIPQASASTTSGKWEKSRFQGVELTGKTLGVVGTGNIGGIVCQKALGLGMKVVAYDPFLTEERADQLGVEKVELDALWPQADFITLHVPLLDSTKGIVGDASIAHMKEGVRIVNASRGGTVDEAALVRGLESGKVAGAALDVFEVEPIASDNPLLNRSDVVLTPHLGASTKDAQIQVAVDAAKQMIAFFSEGQKINNLNDI
jgi:D-3-phosphoglycerate dehydrogenase / 2-oxoglutarate reductase